MINGRPQVDLIVGGLHHDMSAVRLRLLKTLDRWPLAQVRCHADFGDGAALANADFLITYTNNIIPEGEPLDALERFLEHGGRWLAIHGAAALTRFQPPPVEIGGIALPGLTDTPDLAPDYMRLLGVRFVSHLAQQPFVVRPGPVAHAVTEGLPSFEIVDEPYILELRGACDVLLESRYRGEAPGYVAGPWWDDEPRPQLVHHRQGAGEVMYMAPGHACGRYDLRPFIDDVPVQPGPWTNEAYVELVTRIVAWGLGDISV